MNILEMSAGGGVLIAAILAVRRYLLHRVPKWTFLLLWGAALCRLLIPAALPSPISVYTGAAWVGEMIRPAETEQTPVLSPAPNAPTDWEDHPFDAPEHLWEESWTLPAVVSEQEMREVPGSGPDHNGKNEAVSAADTGIEADFFDS